MTNIDEIALKLAHRKCTRYDHVPTDMGIKYSFSEHNLIDFAHALLAEIEQRVAVACAKFVHRNVGTLEDVDTVIDGMNSGKWREYL